MLPSLGEAAGKMQNAVSRLLGHRGTRQEDKNKSRQSSRGGESCGSASPCAGLDISAGRRKEDPRRDEVVARCHTLANPGGGTSSPQQRESAPLSLEPAPRTLTPPGCKHPALGTRSSPISSLPSLQGYKQHWQRLADNEKERMLPQKLDLEL